ncbi:MAG: hypothetical protein WC002_10060, partial [Candidatus Muiribacteriota bacterium]
MLKKIIFFTIIFSVLLTVFFYPAFYFSGKINNFSKKNKFFSDTKPFFKNEYSKITESKKAIEPSVKTEKKSLSTEITGVIKTQIGNVILNLKNELLEIIGENYINFSFNIFDQSLSFSVKSPYINDTFSGSFDIETGDVLIVNSKNYGLRGNLWNKKLIFIYEMDSLTIDNIMLSKINISIFYDEIFEISGSIEKIVAGEFSYNDFTFNYLQEKGTFEASSSDGLIRIFTDSEKNVYGIVKDIDYEFFDTSLKLHIDELRFDFTDNRLTFSPENFYFEIFNSRYNFSNGEVFYSNGIFEVKDAVFSNGSDFILFNADYSENNINYSISHKGNQKLEINENFHFFQREFEIYGTNSNFYGKASFEKGVINFENNQFLISGDLKLNSEENSSGLISIFQNEKEYKFLVSSEENFSKFFIKALSSYNFSLNTDFYDTDLKAYIMLEIIRDKENIV